MQGRKGGGENLTSSGFAQYSWTDLWGGGRSFFQSHNNNHRPRSLLSLPIDTPYASR